MKVLDLFSGIGGFSLGLERAGMETVAFCEFDKKAQLVLKKHWPNVPIYDDVRELNGEKIREEIGAVQIISGGFPCQPFSQAGKRKGEEDDRHLWPEYFRLIQEIRPRWVIGENVAGLISMGLDQVLSDLESENYSCQTLVIPTCALNAPHRRDRVWIIAHAEGIGDRREGGDMGEEDGEEDGEGGAIAIGQPIHDSQDVSNSNRVGCKDPLERQDQVRQFKCGDKQTEGRGQDVADSNGQGSQLSEETRNDGKNRAEPNDQLIGGLCESSGTNQWAVEPDVGRVAHGIPNRVDRLKQLGNAVVPQVVEQIGRAIMQIERRNHGNNKKGQHRHHHDQYATGRS